MMTCKSVQSVLSAYIDGELGGYEMLRVRSHLHNCRSCTEEVEQIRSLKWVIGNFPESSPREGFSDSLKKAVFASQQKTRTRASPVTMISGLAFFAALLVSLATLRTQGHPVVAHPKPASLPAASFDVSRDQAYQSGGDAFNDGSMIITASAPVNGSR
jgi:predicted anti-sigma-YlaC factor YlaD